MNQFKLRFTFKPVEVKDRSLIHKWLVQSHIAEWIHGIGLQNTINGLEKFFQGESDTTYWIACDKNAPFAFLITSPEGDDATTLDLFICDMNYLGKGVATWGCFKAIRIERGNLLQLFLSLGEVQQESVF